MLPALLLGPLAGVFADRFDRRYLMVVCDLVRFVLFASIPVAALVTSNSAVVIGWTAIATFLVEAVTMAWLPAKDATPIGIFRDVDRPVFRRGAVESATESQLADLLSAGETWTVA